MAAITRQPKLEDEEIRMIAEFMRFAAHNCTIETASDDVDITQAKVTNVISILKAILGQ